MQDVPVASQAIGANRPPEPMIETLEQRLRRENKKTFEEIELWLGSGERAPEKCESDETFQNLGKICAKLVHFQSKKGPLETVREREKAPILADGRIIDTLFNGFKQRCEALQAKLEARQKPWSRKKETEARAQAEAAAQAAEAEAEAARKAAEKAQDRGDFDGAAELLGEASRAAAVASEATVIAEAKPADLVRTYSSGGGTVISAQPKWETELQDRSKIVWSELAPYLGDDVLLKAAKAAVRGGIRNLSGFRIWDDRKMVNRGLG